MRKTLLALLVALAAIAAAQVDTKDGTAITTSTTLDGESGLDTGDGQAITSGAAASSLMTGILHWWEMDEQSGTRADSIGSADLSQSGTVGYVNDATFGDVADFDGADDFLQDDPTPISASSGTYAFWAYRDTGGGDVYGRVIDDAKDDGAFEGLSLQLSNFGFLYHAVGDGDSNDECNASYNEDQWNLHVISYNATSSTHYNVTEVNSCANASLDATPPRGSNPLTFGGVSGEYLLGQIAKAGFWNRILTSAERTCLLNSGSGTSPPFTGLCTP